MKPFDPKKAAEQSLKLRSESGPKLSEAELDEFRKEVLDAPFDWNANRSDPKENADGSFEELVEEIRDLQVRFHAERKYEVTFHLDVLGLIIVDLQSELVAIAHLIRTTPAEAASKLEALVSLKRGPKLSEEQMAYYLAAYEAEQAKKEEETKAERARIERASAMGKAAGKKRAKPDRAD